MKLDAPYLQQLLTAFQDAPNPTTSIRELQDAGFSLDDPKFEFHMTILSEKGFIHSDTGGIGLDTSADGSRMWSIDTEFRLTSLGHEVADEINSSAEPKTLKHFGF